MKLGKTTTENYNLLNKVYRIEYLWHVRIFEWFKLIQDDRGDVEDD